jgi:cell division protein FtsB
LSRPEAPARTASLRPVLGAVVASIVVLLTVAGLKSYRDLETARQREHLLERRIEESRQQIERLRVRIDRLRGDPGLLERLARENLGMVRPGDVVIELPQQPAAPPPTAPPPANAPVKATPPPAAVPAQPAPTAPAPPAPMAGAPAPHSG